jgi:DNA-binding LacI/PurR family transcriptional regulator
METSRVTMEDVAARAGVSRALVSIVFRGVPGASDETRARVLAAARELDYRPDTRASRLGRGRTRMLGVTFAVGHTFHGEVLGSLYAQADRAGYEVVLSGVTPERSDADAVDNLLAERCEALLLVGSGLPASAMGRLAERMPVVSLLRPVRRAGSVGVVRTDDAAGLRLAVAHLRSLGHERIALLDGGRAAGAAERRQGYQCGMRANPLLQEQVFPGGLTELEGAEAAEAFLALPDRPTAVTAFNDRCALGFIDLVRQVGVRVPEDVSVVGFDDIAQAAYPHVALTTVRQDLNRLGAAVVRWVTSRLEGLAAERGSDAVIVEPELVVRRSTASRH